MTTKIVVVTSGKGGVGKTTTSASFATGLAMRGFKTCVIDFDVGLRNLDLIMGVERRVVYDLINVVNDEIKLTQALIKDKQLDKLYILAASQTRDKDALKQEGVERVLENCGMRAVVLGDGPLAQIAFTTAEVRDYRSSRHSDPTFARRLMLELFARGVFLNPMGTKLYLSLAHDEAVCDEFCELLAAALESVSADRDLEMRGSR